MDAVEANADGLEYSGRRPSARGPRASIHSSLGPAPPHVPRFDCEADQVLVSVEDLDNSSSVLLKRNSWTRSIAMGRLLAYSCSFSIPMG
jgi:hypothetical protein